MENAKVEMDAKYKSEIFLFAGILGAISFKVSKECKGL
jgi:hypothetical protein